jgi:branched-chain amino acid transport system permease protein
VSSARAPVWAIGLFGLVVLALLPVPLVASAYLISFLVLLFLSVGLAASWNLISGYTGYTSFGHAGFFGLGSYVAALLVFYWRFPWVVACAAAGLFAFAVALAVGWPTLRLRGPYFAIAMLGLSEVARIFVTIWDQVTRGGLGVYLPAPEDPGPAYYWSLAVAVLAVALTYAVASSALGMRLMAIREDEPAAEANGIATTRHKLFAFSVSAVFPGVLGGLYAYHFAYIDPGTVFSVSWSIRAIVMTMFGGAGTVVGPVLGSVLLTTISEAVWAQNPFLYQVLFGLMLVVVVLFMPGGLIVLLQRRGWLPRARWL